MAQPWFWWGSDAPGPRFGDTLDPLENPNVFVYHLERRRKGVCQWIFLLGCVRLGHRNMGNQLLSQVVTRLPLVRPKWEFSPLSVETY